MAIWKLLSGASRRVRALGEGIGGEPPCPAFSVSSPLAPGQDAGTKQPTSEAWPVSLVITELPVMKMQGVSPCST